MESAAMVRYCMDFFKCTLWMYVGHIFSWRKRHLQLPTWKFNWISLDLGFEATSIWVRTTTYIDWLVVWNIFHFSIYWEFHTPNWLSYFSEGWLNHQPDDYGMTMVTWSDSPIGTVRFVTDVLLLNAYQLEVSIISVKNVRLRGKKVL